MQFHTGLRIQRGRGLGSFFGSLFRTLKPLASMGLSAGKRLLSSDLAKKLGSTALDVGKSAAKNIALDLLEGKKFKDTAKEQLETAKSRIADTLKGSGKQKKRKRKQITNTKGVKQIKYNLLE